MKTFLVLALLAVAAIWFLGGVGQPTAQPASLSNVAQGEQFTDAEFRLWLNVNALAPARAFYCQANGQAGHYTSCTVLDGVQVYTVRRVNGQLVRE